MMIKVTAPTFLMLDHEKKYYLSFNNYQNWSLGQKKILKKTYSELIKKQLLNNPTRLEGRVKCVAVFYAPDDKRKRDLDNHCMLHVKYCADALTEIGCWNDDEGICEVAYHKGGFDKDNPRVELTYTLLPPN